MWIPNACKSPETYAFHCIPPSLNNLDELHGMGLFLNDLNPHGLSKEMVMAGWQHCSR